MKKQLSTHSYFKTIKNRDENKQEKLYTIQARSAKNVTVNNSLFLKISCLINGRLRLFLPPPVLVYLSLLMLFFP